MAYDPLGRLSQTSGGTSGTTQFLYDGDQLVAEYSGGAIIRRYIHGPGVDDPLIWYEGSGTGDRRQLFANHQGSIVAVANASGAKIAINSYGPYGEPTQQHQGRFGYAGQAWLPDLAMWHYKARIYSPDLGRFLQTDPIGYEDQVNLYAFVGNDPMNATDPTGKIIDTIADIVFIAAHVADIATNGLNVTNGLSLGANVIAIAVPGVTGAGAATTASHTLYALAMTCREAARCVA